MRVALSLAVALLLAIPTTATAHYHDQNCPRHSCGYQQNGTPLTSVAQTRNAGDDTLVSLQGQIVNHIRDDKFLFKDATGSVVIEVDDDDMRAINLRPGTAVHIRGKVDRKTNRENEIDVKWIELSR